MGSEMCIRDRCVDVCVEEGCEGGSPSKKGLHKCTLYQKRHRQKEQREKI